jgi:hypothetical protein
MRVEFLELHTSHEKCNKQTQIVAGVQRASQNAVVQQRTSAAKLVRFGIIPSH